MEKSFWCVWLPVQDKEWGTLTSTAKCGWNHQIFLQAEMRAVRMACSTAKCCNCCLLQAQMLMPRNLLCLTATASSQIWETLCPFLLAAVAVLFKPDAQISRMCCCCHLMLYDVVLPHIPCFINGTCIDQAGNSAVRLHMRPVQHPRKVAIGFSGCQDQVLCKSELFL